MGVEIDGDVEVLLEQLHERAHALGRNQTRHVLDRDHVGAQGRHLPGLVEEVGVGEHGPGLLAAHQACEESRLGVFRIDGVAHGAVGDAAVLFHVFDRGLDVVHVVQGVEDAHDAQAAADGVAAETVDDLVRVGRVAEEIAAAREGCQFRHVAHGLADGFEAGPRVLVQIAHHRVGHGAAPHLHRIEARILVVGQAAVDLLLRHARGERRLLAVAERQVSDLKISCHCFYVLESYRRTICCYPNNKVNKQFQISIIPTKKLANYPPFPFRGIS